MKYKDRTIATIDLGTNSVLLLIIRRNEKGELHVLHDGSEVVRLGENMRKTNRISEPAVSRTIQALRKYQQVISSFPTEKIFLTATSAIREAENQSDVIQVIEAETQLEIEVLPRVEEVRLMYKSVLAEEPHQDPSLVIDIGGGSTEVGWGIGSRYDGGRSLNLGTIKLLDGPLANPIPTDAELENTRNEIDQELKRITPLGTLRHYYGTAGAFTQAAALQMKLSPYDSRAVDGFRLKQNDVENWVKVLAPMDIQGKRKLPGIDLKRIDVLVPGLIVIERLFKKFQTDEFIVRDRGIRYGKAFDQFRDFHPPVFFDNG